MTFEQKAIELDHRVIVLNNKLSELEKTIEEMHYLIGRGGWCSKDDLLNFRKEVADDILSNKVDRSILETPNFETLKCSYAIALKCMKGVYNHCRLHEAISIYEDKKPTKRLQAIGDYVFKALNKIGETME